MAAVTTRRRSRSASFSLSLSRCTHVPGRDRAQVTGPTRGSRPSTGMPSRPVRREPALVMASGGTEELRLPPSSSAQPRGSRAFWERICIPRAPRFGPHRGKGWGVGGGVTSRAAPRREFVRVLGRGWAAGQQLPPASVPSHPPGPWFQRPRVGHGGAAAPCGPAPCPPLVLGDDPVGELVCHGARSRNPQPATRGAGPARGPGLVSR